MTYGAAERKHSTSFGGAPFGEEPTMYATHAVQQQPYRPARPVHTVVVPAAYSRPTRAMYVRRRIAVLSVLATMSCLLVVAGTSLAGRGGAPASASSARPSASAQLYVVQPGDTMWSIAQVLRGERGQRSYVDALIQLNGGHELVVGQRLVLPGS
jgi:Tfp pilus assembly protein FimV